MADIPQDFWKQVNRPSDSTCWLWTGRTRAGYGLYLTQANSDERAHRFVFHLFNGDIPFNHDVHHTCGNKLCVNPQHLKAVTRSDHMKKHGAGNTLPTGAADMITTIRVSPVVHKRISDLARVEQRTWANMMRVLVNEALDQRSRDL